MSYLEKSILSTIVYYDNLGQSLTGFEIYKYLIKPKNHSHLTGVLDKGYGFLEALNCLKESQSLKEFVQFKNGLYFLKGKDNLIRRRMTKNRFVIKKWKRVKRVVKILGTIPFVEMVAVSGSLATNNTRKKSDIDLLIIAKSGRIWLARVLVTLFIQIIGARRNKKTTTDRFCLNHYIADELPHIPFHSLYNAQSYTRLVLVYQKDKKNIFMKFQESNSWLKEYLFNYRRQETNLHTIKSNGFLAKTSLFFEYILGGFLGNILEKIFKTYQSYRIRKDPLTQKKGGRITFDDSQLEFHPDSPELKIIQSFNKKTFELGLLEYTNQEDSGLTK